MYVIPPLRTTSDLKQNYRTYECFAYQECGCHYKASIRLEEAIARPWNFKPRFWGITGVLWHCSVWGFNRRWGRAEHAGGGGCHTAPRQPAAARHCGSRPAIVGIYGTIGPILTLSSREAIDSRLSADVPGGLCFPISHPIPIHHYNCLSKTFHIADRLWNDFSLPIYCTYVHHSRFSCNRFNP